MTLVSAPAGFGKTTLLAEWLAGGPAAPADGRSVAWLSLDRDDNDPASFWTYVIAALRTVVPGIGASELALLQSPQPPPIQVVLTTLLNDVGAEGGDIVLVLDDYHLIDDHDVQEQLAFLLDHLPPRLHLVIASRADPALPLAQLRARGDLVELRAAELRFTPDEAVAYLNGVMGLELTTQDVAALEERTEGWIAALQLAALSMQGRGDLPGFIAGFTGDDRYIVDYLAEEVLQRQPAPVRDFLLQTSILGRLNGPLCDAVTERGGGKAMLEALDRGNLFVVRLDDRRQWYRYHHLFADVLGARLSDEQPDLVNGLHRRASDWYAENGERSEAIGHAMAGGHFERAAELVELAIPAMLRDRRKVALRGWLEALPDTLVQVRPVLSNGYAGALLSTGEVEGVDRRLRDAERWLDTPDETMMVVADVEELRRLPAGVAVHRSGLALAQGDHSATVTHAQRALHLLEERDDLGRGAATALIGLACWAGGDLAAARAAYASCVDSMLRAGHVADVLGCSIALADIQITQGHLREAMRTYEHALQLTPQDGGPVLRGTPDMFVGLSVLRHSPDDSSYVAKKILGRVAKESMAELGVGDLAKRRDPAWTVTVVVDALEELPGEESDDAEVAKEELNDLLQRAIDSGRLSAADRDLLLDLATRGREPPCTRSARPRRIDDAFGHTDGRGKSRDVIALRPSPRLGRNQGPSGGGRIRATSDVSAGFAHSGADVESPPADSGSVAARMLSVSSACVRWSWGSARQDG